MVNEPLPPDPYDILIFWPFQSPRKPTRRDVLLSRKPAPQALATSGGETKMWLGFIDLGLRWYDHLAVFSQGDPFERFVPQPVRTSGIETAAAIAMVVSVIGAAAAILAKIVM